MSHLPRLLTLLSALASPSFANEAPGHPRVCDCSRFAHLAQLGELSAHAGAIGLNAFHPEGGAFALEPSDRSNFQLMVDGSNLIPQECRAELFAARIPRFRLVMSGALSRSPDAPENSGVTSNALLNAYHRLVGLFSPYCEIQDPASVEQNHRYINCLRARNGPAYERFRAGFSGQSPAEVRTQAASWGQLNPLTNLSDGDLQVISLYDRVLNAGSEENVLELLRTQGHSLSIDQRLSLVQMFGVRFNANYDYERLRGGTPQSAGVVTLSQLIEASLRNTQARYLAASEDNPDTNRAGVCRDIASAQARMRVF